MSSLSTDVTVRILGRTFRLADLAKSRLISDFALVTLLRLCQVGFGLFTTYFLTRTLSKAEFGEYHFILNFVGLLTIFSLKELNNAVMQSVARGFLGTFRASLVYSLVGSVLGAIILFLLGLWHFYLRQIDLGFGFVIAAVFFTVTHGLTQWKSVRMGRGDFAGFVRYEGISAMIMHLMIVGSIFAVPHTYFLPLALLLGVPASLNLIATFVALRRLPRGAPAESKSIRYGIRTSLYMALQIGAKHIDKLLLFLFLSPIALATYVAADRIADLLATATQNVAAVLGPRFAKQRSYSRDLDRMLMYLAWAVGVAFVVFAFTAMPWLLTAIFSHRYADAVPYAQALICTVAFGNLARFRFRYIRSTLDESSVRSVVLITSGVRIGAVAALVPLFGIVGAVIAAFLYTVSLIISVRHLMQTKYLDAQPSRAVDEEREDCCL
jgi:O-antigen/teichoic acid export membrane protein